MHLHKPNTPEWWALFFECDRSAQLPLVHEAIAVEFGLSPEWDDKFWNRAITHWERKKRALMFQGDFSTPQMAMMLAGSELTVAQEMPFVIEQVEIIEHRWRLPLALPRYDVGRWTVEVDSAYMLLRERFPWVWGWRKQCIADRAEATLGYRAALTDVGKN